MHVFGPVTGSCSSSGTNVSGILKAIKSLSEVICNNCSDEIELEEHDHSLLHSVIENLQSCLHKARKVRHFCNFCQCEINSVDHISMRI